MMKTLSIATAMILASAACVRAVAEKDAVAKDAAAAEKPVVAKADVAQKENMAAGDEEVVEVLAELERLRKDLLALVSSAADPAEGLVLAQRRLESESPRLHPRIRALRLRRHQLSKEMDKKVLDSLSNASIMLLEQKYEIRSASDPAFRASLEKLKSAYLALISTDE